MFVCFETIKSKKLFQILNLKLKDKGFSVRARANMEVVTYFIATKIFFAET